MFVFYNIELINHSIYNINKRCSVVLMEYKHGEKIV